MAGGSLVTSKASSSAKAACSSGKVLRSSGRDGSSSSVRAGSSSSVRAGLSSSGRLDEVFCYRRQRGTDNSPVFDPIIYCIA